MNRRSLLTGLIGVLAAPAVAPAEGLMKIAAPLVIGRELDVYELVRLFRKIQHDQLIDALNHRALAQMIDAVMLSSKPQSPWQPQKLQFSANIDHTNWGAT